MNFNSIIGNWRTTLAGFIGGAIVYLNQAGLNLPSDKEGVKTALIGAAIAYLGAMAKDAKTGSKAE